MADYPLSSLPENRECSHFLYKPMPTCAEYPCRHTPCHDTDWLRDQEDMYEDFWKHHELWNCFRWSEYYKGLLSSENWSIHEAKFERCRRIEDKRSEIKISLEAHATLLAEEKKHCWDLLPRDTKKMIEAANKRFAEQGRKVWEKIKRRKESGELRPIPYEDWLLQHRYMPEAELTRLGLTKNDIRYMKKLALETKQNRRLRSSDLGVH
jgi:hypothetical protein